MLTDRLNYRRILTFLFLLSVFLLALCKIWDTDTWMHLSFGKLIWKLKGLPAKEPFMYPSFDLPLLYTSWLFAVIYYLLYNTLGVYGITLFKMITVSLAFFILIKDSLRPHKNYIVAIAVLSAVVLVARHRFEERPDTFLMVFLSFSIFSLNAFMYENKKYIYALPFIHLLWANSHSSINLMFVPFLSFLAGGLVQEYINKKSPRMWRFACTPTTTQLKVVALIFFLSLAASLINPNFTGQFTYGLQVLSSDWWRHAVDELKPPSWQTNKWPYLLTGVVVLSFILNWVTAWKEVRIQKSRPAVTEQPPTAVGSAPLIHFSLVVPFVVLSFEAMRFSFLLAMVAGPIVARNISSVFPSTVRGQTASEQPARLPAILLSFWIVLYTALALLQIPPFENKLHQFGFGINYVRLPEAALGYMDRKGITGRIFNTFHWGGYITWRDFPGRSAFIDGRGYLSDALLEKAAIALVEPSVMDQIFRKYGFDVILTEFSAVASVIEVLPETDVSFLGPEWALVYWDDQSFIHLRRGGKYDRLIQEDEYRLIKPTESVYETIGTQVHDEHARSQMLQELLRNIRETGSSKAYAYLGYLYNASGLYREAIDAFSRVKDLPLSGHLTDAYKGTAYSYGKLGYLDESIAYYKKALAVNNEADSLYNIGILYNKKNDKKTAITYFRKALELNSNFTDVYLPLIGIYQELGREDDARTTVTLYAKAQRVQESHEHFVNGSRALGEKRFDAAMQEFTEAVEKDPSNPAPYSSLGLIYFSMDRVDAAYEYQKKALAIDPNFANAHYRIALIYKKWGDRKMAKRHWKEYLRIEPEGYFSRKAKEELRSLSFAR